MGLIYDFDLLNNKINIYNEIMNIINEKNINLRCRNVAKKELSFDKSIELYKKILFNLLN